MHQLLNLAPIVLVTIAVHERVDVITHNDSHCRAELYDRFHALAHREHYQVVRDVGCDEEAADKATDFSHPDLVVNLSDFAGGVDVRGALDELDHDNGVADNCYKETRNNLAE